jgi:hypothetical protein
MMFKNLLSGATSKMMTVSAVASLLTTGLIVSSAVAVTSTYNSNQNMDHQSAFSLQAESSNKSRVTIGSNSVWPASQESTSVDITDNKQDKNTTEAATEDNNGSDSQSGVEVDKNVANSDSAADSQAESSSSKSSNDNSNETVPSTNDSQSSQSAGESTGTGSPQPQSPGYNYLLNVSGYCDGGWDCAQAAVNSYSLSYIYYAPNFQMIAGHNYGEAGVIANFTPGDVIKVTGNGAGLYRITHTQWMEYTTDVQQVGGQFAFQTCVGSKMLHAYAVRIG